MRTPFIGLNIKSKAILQGDTWLDGRGSPDEYFCEALEKKRRIEKVKAALLLPSNYSGPSTSKNIEDFCPNDSKFFDYEQFKDALEERRRLDKVKAALLLPQKFLGPSDPKEIQINCLNDKEDTFDYLRLCDALEERKRLESVKAALLLPPNYLSTTFMQHENRMENESFHEMTVLQGGGDAMMRGGFKTNTSEFVNNYCIVDQDGQHQNSNVNTHKTFGSRHNQRALYTYKTVDENDHGINLNNCDLKLPAYNVYVSDCKHRPEAYHNSNPLRYYDISRPYRFKTMEMDQTRIPYNNKCIDFGNGYPAIDIKNDSAILNNPIDRASHVEEINKVIVNQYDSNIPKQSYPPDSSSNKYDNNNKYNEREIIMNKYLSCKNEDLLIKEKNKGLKLENRLQTVEELTEEDLETETDDKECIIDGVVRKLSESMKIQAICKKNLVKFKAKTIEGKRKYEHTSRETKATSNKNRVCEESNSESSSSHKITEPVEYQDIVKRKYKNTRACSCPGETERNKHYEESTADNNSLVMALKTMESDIINEKLYNRKYYRETNSKISKKTRTSRNNRNRPSKEKLKSGKPRKKSMECSYSDKSCSDSESDRSGSLCSRCQYYEQLKHRHVKSKCKKYSRPENFGKSYDGPGNQVTESSTIDLRCCTIKQIIDMDGSERTTNSNLLGQNECKHNRINRDHENPFSDNKKGGKTIWTLFRSKAAQGDPLALRKWTSNDSDHLKRTKPKKWYYLCFNP